MKRDWIQILSNFAILVGLVMVAYELNQSQRLATVQSQQEWTSMFNDALLVAVDSPYLPKILQKFEEDGIEALDDEERRRLGSTCCTCNTKRAF